MILIMLTPLLIFISVISSGNMADLSLKELKDILDDGDLDLSARGLAAVPHGVLQLPRATHIDLGCNRISVLLPELCNMNRITRLELGSNQLMVLPDNFGNLANLQHLDLFNNQIEELPLSFANLQRLKWLDLKRNPLEASLAKAVGNCGSEKECKQAAVNAVGYVKYLQKNMEIQKAKQAEVNQKIQAVKAEGQAKNKKKAAKKESPPRKEDSASKKVSNHKTAPAQHKEQNKPKDTKEMSKSSGSFIGNMLRFIFRWTFFTMLCLTSAATVSILMNCNDGATKIPGSKPLCADLSRMVEFKKPSDKFLVNVRSTYGTVFNSYQRGVMPYWKQASAKTSYYYKQAVKSDAGKKAEKFMYDAHAFVVEKTLLAQRFILQQWSALSAWYARDGHKMVGRAVEHTKVVGGMMYEVAKDGVNMGAAAISAVYHRTEAFVVAVQEKGFSKALETVF